MKIFLTLLHSREGTGIQEIERTAVVDKVEVEIETVMVATMDEETVRIMTQAEAVAEEVPEEAVEAEAAEAEEIPEAVVMAEAAVVAEDLVAAVNRHSIVTIVLQKDQAEVEAAAAITRVNLVTTTDVDENARLRSI